jgi:hypothetical protein
MPRLSASSFRLLIWASAGSAIIFLQYGLSPANTRRENKSPPFSRENSVGGSAINFVQHLCCVRVQANVCAQQRNHTP